MATKKGDYFGLSYIVSLILAIIPITAWICGMITRFSEGKIVAGIIRIFGGWLIWVLDLFCMIFSKHMFRAEAIKHQFAIYARFNLREL